MRRLLLLTALAVSFLAAQGPINNGLPVYVEATVASASTITPTGSVLLITGTTAIATINLPTGCTTTGDDCQIFLLADTATGPFTLNTSGNIAVAQSPSAGAVVGLIYRPTDSKWHPFGGAPGATGAVSSVFTRTGAVTAQTGDYTAAQVTNAVDKTAANTYTGGGLQDLSAMNLKYPAGAGFTSTSSNNIGYDTTGTNLHIWNGADGILAPFPTTPTTGHCVQVTVAGSKITLSDSGSTNCGGGGSVNWNAIGNPSGNFTPSMGTNTSLFSFTSALASAFQWYNTTAATSGTSQSGPSLDLSCGNEWHGAASVLGCATFQFVPGNGTDAASQLVIKHTGSATGVMGLCLGASCPASAWFTGSGSAAAYVNGTCTGTIPASIGVFCDNAGFPYWMQSTGNNYLALLTGTQTAKGLLFSDPTTPNTNVDSSADFTLTSHTLAGGASAILDMSAASVTAGLKLPSAAGAAPTADGFIAINTTTHLPAFGSNSATITPGFLSVAETWSALQTFGTNLSVAGTTISALSGSGTVLALGTSPAFTTDIHSVTAGSATVGTAALPFGSVYLGNAATNNIKLTGTSAAARIATIPDVAADKTVSLETTSTTANQISVSTTTAGLSAYKDLPQVFEWPAANCVSTVAGSAWNTTLTPTCFAGTNNLGGYLPFVDASTGQFAFQIPGDWDATTQPYIKIVFGSLANTTGTVIFNVATACTKEDGSVTSDPTFATADALTTKTMAAASRMWSTTVQMTQVTSGNNCLPGGLMLVKVTRATDTASTAVSVEKAVITVPRLPVVQAN